MYNGNLICSKKSKKANNFRGQRNESFKKLVFPIVSSVSKYKIRNAAHSLRKSSWTPWSCATHTCKGLICMCRVCVCVQFHPLAATVSQVCMRTVLTYSAWPSSSSTMCTSVCVVCCTLRMINVAPHAEIYPHCQQQEQEQAPALQEQFSSSRAGRERERGEVRSA